MRKLTLSLIATLLFFGTLPAQNVGVGTNTPAEKLDVNGNINLTGTIKANGNDGTANQVLMKNNSNQLAWGNLCDFKEAVTFTTPGSGNWAIPAGVTRVWVEAWGGGGGPSNLGGGAGGGYVSGVFLVSGGSIAYTVGAAGNAGLPGTAGGFSIVSYNTYFVQALGGEGNNSAATFQVAAGGGFQGSSNSGFYGMPGQAGGTSILGAFQVGATTWRETQHTGHGGDAGNSTHTGGRGGYLVRDATSSTVLYALYGAGGKIPGGGGAASGTWGGSLFNGAPGMVIIHY